jgi:hypothetical protein
VNYCTSRKNVGSRQMSPALDAEKVQDIWGVPIRTGICDDGFTQAPGEAVGTDTTTLHIYIASVLTLGSWSTVG